MIAFEQVLKVSTDLPIVGFQEGGGRAVGGEVTALRGESVSRNLGLPGAGCEAGEEAGVGHTAAAGVGVCLSPSRCLGVGTVILSAGVTESALGHRGTTQTISTQPCTWDWAGSSVSVQAVRVPDGSLTD